MARSDKFTLTRKKQVIYRDFMNNFDKNPFTGNLGVVENEDAVKQALKNIFLTGEGERFMDSSKGGNIRHMLFENFDPGIIETYKMEMQSVISRYEPRAQIMDIRVDDSNIDNNALDITIVFKVANITEIQELSFVVNRVR